MGRHWTWRTGIVGGAMVAAGCGGGATEMSVVMSDFAFEPSRFSLPQREKTALLFENKGAVEHNFFIPQLNLNSGTVAPGAKARLEIVPTRGPLKFICNIPGHEESGMIGEIAVTEKRR